MWNEIKANFLKEIKDRWDLMRWMLTSRWYWLYFFPVLVIVSFIMAWFETHKE